jgi:glycyl-tRNA synthetase beta chain
LPANFEKSNFLDELVGLCESPEVLVGEIDNKFLELPSEALILTLQYNQKYICCSDFDGKFSSKFLFVVDCEINENNVKKIIADNEKIMRARLTDLEFFVEEDLKNHLSDYLIKLQKIIYHQKIGTMLEKVERLKEMAKFLSIFVPHCEIGLIDRAVDLSKADLATKAVAELPELQGRFGSFYATKQLENHKIADAIYEHYLPDGANSPTAQSPLGITMAIADKIDTIVGFFLVNEKPTSSKDPFALRRCALGIIRTSHQHNIAFPIRILVERSLKSYPLKLLKKHISKNKKEFFELKRNLIEEIVRFIVERLKIYLKEQEQVRQDVLNVVMNAYLESLESHKSVDILYLIKKIKFLDNFLSSDNHKKLIELYKRSTNILAIEEKKDNKKYRGRPSVLGFKSKYERLLYRRIKQISRDFYKFITKAEFEKAFALLAVIEAPLDHFFEHVVVNDVDNYARENRLILLAMIRDLFHEVGDLSVVI